MTGSGNPIVAPLIDAEGLPKDIGLQIGRTAGEQILRSIEIYRRGFLERGVDWKLACTIARRIAERIERCAPEALAEMQGLAEGCGVSLEEIVAINARTELLYGGFGSPGVAEDPDGCTGAIALPAATRDAHLLHVQNWDWRDECAESCVVLRLVPANGPQMLIFVEAGMMARAGMNSAGMAITGNFLECDRDGSREGLPVPVIRRQILSQDTLGAALEKVLQSERAFSINLMLSHKDGEAFDLETTPDEVFWIAPENDLLVHANHFVSAAARSKVRDTGVISNGDSLYRDLRVRRHLERNHGHISTLTMKEAMQDKFGSPRAVCRSPVSGPGGKSSSTVATVLMDTTAGIMWVAMRPYGPHEFVEYRLS